MGLASTYQAYVVKKDTCVGTSIAQAQDPTKGFGAGGGTQYFLSNFKTKVRAVGPRVPLGP